MEQKPQRRFNNLQPRAGLKRRDSLADEERRRLGNAALAWLPSDAGVDDMTQRRASSSANSANYNSNLNSFSKAKEERVVKGKRD